MTNPTSVPSVVKRNLFRLEAGSRVEAPVTRRFDRTEFTTRWSLNRLDYLPAAPESVKDMDTATVSRIVSDVILNSRLPCELVDVQEEARTWRVTIRDQQQGLISFDVTKGIRPVHVREAVQTRLESLA